MQDSNVLKERMRLEQLARLAIVDTPFEEAYDDVVMLASQVCETPIALISMIDKDRQWFKACIGIEVSETSRETAICNNLIDNPRPLVVDDLEQDPRFKDNPFVQGPAGVRFYAGIPLFSNGHVMGALCIIDFKSRKLDEKQLRSLEALARQVTKHLELRQALSELKRMELEAVSESLRYSALVNHLKEVVFQVDAQGCLSFLSPAWEEIMGFAAGESLGKELISFLHAEDREFNEETVKSILERRRLTLRHQARFIHKNGETVWLDVFARMTFDANGEFLALTGTLADITERRSQEKMIREQRMRIVETARLSALGEMAAGIAHEVNNPLAIIRGTAQILYKAAKSGELDRAALLKSSQRIDTMVGRIAQIVSSLKFFSGDGGSEPFEEAAISPILDIALVPFQTRFANHGVNLTINNQVGDLSIECRPSQVAQVIFSLLSNAFDAVEECERKEVEIRLSDEGEYLELILLDTGKGLPAEIEKKIIEPFFTTKGVGRGIGLGLSRSKGLVESHNGQLTYGRVDDRTFFKVLFPKRQPLASAV